MVHRSLAVLTMGCALSVVANAQVYKFIPLSYPSNEDTLSWTIGAINGSGAIVGTVIDLSRPQSAPQGFYRTPQGSYSILSFPLSSLNNPSGVVGATYLTGINYSGEIVGTVLDSQAKATHAFLLVNDTFTIIDPPGVTTVAGKGIGVKNTGETLGSDDVNASAGSYIRSQAGSYAFMRCPKIPQSSAHPLTFNSINDHGNSVGTYYDQTTHLSHAFTRTAGGTCALFADPAGAIATVATSINDYGSTAGYYTDSTMAVHGFVWSSGSGFVTVDNGTLGTKLLAINSGGVVLGETKDGTNFYAAPISSSSVTLPSGENFGNVQVGKMSAGIKIHIKNTGIEAIVLGTPVIPPPVGSVNGNFAIATNGCPLILGANQICAITVQMTATGVGSISNVLKLDSTAANGPSQVQLSGTGH
jgi:hypothetical protein